MKVSFEGDEATGLFLDESRQDYEVPDEMVVRWRRIQADFEQMQDEIDKFLTDWYSTPNELRGKT